MELAGSLGMDRDSWAERAALHEERDHYFTGVQLDLPRLKPVTGRLPVRTLTLPDKNMHFDIRCGGRVEGRIELPVGREHRFGNGR
jgi:hypothetical protein